MHRGALNTTGSEINSPFVDAPRPWKQTSNLDRRGNWPWTHCTGFARRSLWRPVPRSGTRRVQGWLEFGETPAATTQSVTQIREVNGVNQYTEFPIQVGQSVTTTQPAYDDAGNLTFDPLAAGPCSGTAGQRYEYDEENRLVRVWKEGSVGVPPAMLVDYHYDAIGRRVETVEHVSASCQPILPRRIRHVYDGLQIVQDYQCANMDPPTCTAWAVVREYIHGRSLSASSGPEPVAMVDYTGGAGVPPAIHHYLHDALGGDIGHTLFIVGRPSASLFSFLTSP
jgi:hypothetical protein